MADPDGACAVWLGYTQLFRTISMSIVLFNVFTLRTGTDLNPVAFIPRYLSSTLPLWEKEDSIIMQRCAVFEMTLNHVIIISS